MSAFYVRLHLCWSKIKKGSGAVKIFNCFGHQFCLHFEAFNLGLAPVYMAFLLFMGNEDDAKRYSYSLEVGGFGRKLTWQGVPRSLRDSHKTVRDSLDGLIIQRNIALYFSGGVMNELELEEGVAEGLAKTTTLPKGEVGIVI
ncbi:E3 ubiquitin-protein ligase SINAT2-like [Capsicum annuum]|uniref:E3 ubiquitin-protein ligase SINAT2-like n=1 Tax=Capsicum annuum TaxID=4072 RepID=UPI001FB05837|nr:E3 ubiquitin-protein ligase SINAT2-like [Capsicum annuum]